MLQSDIEVALVPEYIALRRQGRSRDMDTCGIKGGEVLFGRLRDAGLRFDVRKTHPILIQDEPLAYRQHHAPKRTFHAGKVEVSGTALWQSQALEQGQGDACQKNQPVYLWLDEAPHDDFVRDVVCGGGPSEQWQEQQRHQHSGEQPSPGKGKDRHETSKLSTRGRSDRRAATGTIPDQWDNHRAGRGTGSHEY
jgi:hypothetical protein